jgi:uncharacterized protein (DUF4415 family)
MPKELTDKQQSEAQEVLDTITQEDEAKAADAIIELNKTSDKDNEEDQNRKLEELQESRDIKKNYVYKLGEAMDVIAKFMDLPEGWYYRINCGDTKLNIIVTSPTGVRFGRGIIPTGVVQYDFHAIGVLVMQCENTVDKYLKRGMFKEDSIIVPN